ncbi:MAG: hypothetical protein J7K68_01060 [Candidatus Diapherotrites archaeon]|nr:hypothetical protein [Candidatus Diapherotrites archaeon]
MPPLITTSRNPSRRTRTLTKDLCIRIPNSKQENRGKKSIDDLVDIARKHGLERIVIVTERKGNPGKITAIKVTEWDWEWHPNVIILSGVKLIREFKQAFRERIDALSVHDSIGVSDIFGLEDEESDMVLTADETRITFTFMGREVGPLMKILKVVH